MKSILKTLRPEPIENIINGKQTVIVCKKFPKDYVGWVYIYCTKGKPELNYHILSGRIILGKTNLTCYRLNGKIVARFWCDMVEEIKCSFIGFNFEKYITETLSAEQLEKSSCLTRQELSNYIGNVNVSLGQTRGYAIPISELEVFDKPRKLWEFYCGCEKCGICGKYLPKRQCDKCRLTKAPQNYCYIEGLENDK